MPKGDWTELVRSIQENGEANPKIAPDEITKVLSTIAVKLELDCRNPLIKTDDDDPDADERKRARKLFADALDEASVKYAPGKTSKQVICLWCAAVRPTNSSAIELHYAGTCCTDNLQYERCVRKHADSSTAKARLGKEALAKMAEARAAFEASDSTPIAPPSGGKRSASGSAPASGSGKRAAVGVSKFMDRALGAEEVEEIDKMVCRYIYVEGRPLNTVRSDSLRAIFHKLHSGYLQKSNVSDWNVCNRFLIDEIERVRDGVKEAIKETSAITIVTDSWAGVQKKHFLNIIAHIGWAAFFVANVFTDDNSVTGGGELPSVRAWRAA